MFSEMRNKPGPRKSRNNLEGFEIEMQTILCTVASGLQVMIPYIKQLLQLLTEIKGNTDW